MKSKNFSGTPAQFDETLSAVLIGGAETEFTTGVEAVARVKKETSLAITIQKSIEGIKVCLKRIGHDCIMPDADIVPATTRNHNSCLYGG